VQLRAGALWEDARVETCTWVPHVAVGATIATNDESTNAEEQAGSDGGDVAVRGGRWEVSVAVGKADDPEMSMYVTCKQCLKCGHLNQAISGPFVEA